MPPVTNLVIAALTGPVSVDWAKHGICGRGVLVDLVSYFESGGSPLPYDPWSSHSVELKDILACAKKQGVEFRLGDILILRVGFIRRYSSSSLEERLSFHGKPETLYVIPLTEVGGSVVY